MSDMLSIGASGVRAYQTALATVGENIANVNSAGYTRRQVALNEVAGVGTTFAYAAGNGVTLTGVTRSTDIYSSRALRAANSDLSRTTSGAAWLDRIQGALTGNALTSRVTNFFGAAQALAAEPDSTALRTGMVSAATSAAIAFTATGRAFDQIDADIDTAGNQAAQDLTSLGVSLSKINEGISRSQPGSTAAAQLMDQRDDVLSQMSNLSDITTTFDSIGRATVNLGGSSGAPFVRGTGAGTVTYARDDTGKIAFSITVGIEKTQITPGGGTLGGLVDGAQRASSIRDVLNSVAGQFVKTVNDNQAAGKDQNNQTGAAMFVIDQTRPATEMSVATGFVGSQIAAGTGGGSRDASNLAALEATRNSKGYESQLTTLVTDNATAYKQKNTIADAQTSIRDGAATALSSSTGVNLDSEAVDLIRFQQAYAASSRVIQVARETMQTLLDMR